MKREIAAELVKRLRSRNYTKGRGSLQYVQFTNTDSAPVRKFCCLGVLCEMAVEAGIITSTYTADTPGPVYYGPEGAVHYGPEDRTLEGSILPDAVRVWAEMSTPDGQFSFQNSAEYGYRQLTTLNDATLGVAPYEYSFVVIADVIQRQVDNL